MTSGGWIIFGFGVVLIGLVGLGAVAEFNFSKNSIIVTTFVCILVILALLFVMLWYYNNTADGQRAMIDQKSNLDNGLERTITIYTADGNIIATYTGKIDIETNDGGYIKFDFEGKRYIYYNCFVESIAVIEE